MRLDAKPATSICTTNGFNVDWSWRSKLEHFCCCGFGFSFDQNHLMYLYGLITHKGISQEWVNSHYYVMAANLLRMKWSLIPKLADHIRGSSIQWVFNNLQVGLWLDSFALFGINAAADALEHDAVASSSGQNGSAFLSCSNVSSISLSLFFPTRSMHNVLMQYVFHPWNRFKSIIHNHISMQMCPSWC